jgi:L-fuconolactonase
LIVDAHHHIWDPAARRHAWLDGLPALNRAFSLADFERASQPEGVTASVLVQVLASTEETEEFLALAAGSGTVAGVVGWTDLTSPAVADEIARLQALPGGGRLAGIRHLAQDEPDPGWLLRPEVGRGIRAVGAAGLAYDLLVRPHQLPAALAVTGELADVRFVLDHGAKPAIASGGLEPWAAQISELAARPNVSCKVSGLVTEAGPGWRPAAADVRFRLAGVHARRQVRRGGRARQGCAGRPARTGRTRRGVRGERDRGVPARWGAGVA